MALLIPVVIGWKKMAKSMEATSEATMLNQNVRRSMPGDETLFGGSVIMGGPKCRWSATPSMLRVLKTRGSAGKSYSD